MKRDFRNNDSVTNFLLALIITGSIFGILSFIGLMALDIYVGKASGAVWSCVEWQPTGDYKYFEYPNIPSNAECISREQIITNNGTKFYSELCLVGKVTEQKCVKETLTRSVS